MKRLAKKLAGISLAVIVAATFMPAGFGALGAGGPGSGPGVETAYAGDGMSIASIVQGLNSDHQTIDPGQTLYVYISDLDSAYPGLKDAYQNGEVEIDWGKADDNAFKNSKPAATYVSSGRICTDVTIADAGKWYTLYVDVKSEYASVPNLNSESYQVYDKITINNGPSLSTSYMVSSPSLLKKNYTFNLNYPYDFSISFKDHSFTENKKTIKLYRDGKLVKSQQITGSSVTFNGITVPYGKNAKFDVKIYLKIGTKEIEGANWITFNDTAAKLGKNKVFATKISKSKVVVRWSGVSGAAGYYVYMGSKKIKKLGASKRSYTVKKKNAGKKRYRVIPYYQAYKGTSNTATPKTNKVTWNRSKNPDSYSYAGGDFVVTKVQLKGSYYYVTGFAVNNRIVFKLSKYKKLGFKLYVNNKLVMKKTYRNKSVNLGPGKIKKMTFKIRGKAGKDLVNLPVSVSTSYKPVWK